MNLTTRRTRLRSKRRNLIEVLLMFAFVYACLLQPLLLAAIPLMLVAIFIAAA